ncbi:hypothetical protein B0H10DRAFT_2230004 [Mycena sp. CBHHK59/15]|nr:hypothetical protein B0H10DRAFT_2230004 [Mycena sp. CBHHK59/15]
MAHFLDVLEYHSRTAISAQLVTALSHPALPADTVTKIPPAVPDGEEPEAYLRSLLWNKIDEARIPLLAEFLESCSSPELPYQAAATISHIARRLPSDRVHTAHQICFANSVRDMHYTVYTPELRKAVLESGTLRTYTVPPSQYYVRWLDDPGARRTLRHSLAGTFTAAITLSTPLETILRELGRDLPSSVN